MLRLYVDEEQVQQSQLSNLAINLGTMIRLTYEIDNLLKPSDETLFKANRRNMGTLFSIWKNGVYAYNPIFSVNAEVVKSGLISSILESPERHRNILRRFERHMEEDWGIYAANEASM